MMAQRSMELQKRQVLHGGRGKVLMGRNRDGRVIVDEPTEVVIAEPTHSDGRTVDSGRTRDRSDEGRTRVWPEKEKVPSEQRGDEEEGGGPDGGSDKPILRGPMDDPPVGWLVIVDGPGSGHVLTLGVGVNCIGRDQTERVTLDYGDSMISRTNHGAVTYDPRGGKFYVQPGGGTNLMYVNDEPVLAPRALERLSHLQMGKTVLRFVPLCDDGFSWDGTKPNDR